MNVEVKIGQKPSKISRNADKLFRDAKAGAFIPLGWLSITILYPLTLAAFRNANGTIALAIHDPTGAKSFNGQTIDLVSELDRNRRVTTTSLPVVLPQENAGIYKFSYPGASLEDLIGKHIGHITKISGTPVPRVKSLDDFANFLREYLEYELKAASVGTDSRKNAGRKERAELKANLEKVDSIAVAESVDSKTETSLEGCYVQVGHTAIRVILRNGNFEWGAADIHDSGRYKVIREDAYGCQIEFYSHNFPGEPKQIQLTRKGQQYTFEELPGGSETKFKRPDGVLFLADSRARKQQPIPRLREMEPTGTYVPIREMVERHEKGDFFQNVKKDVIPALIKKGILRGTTVKGEKMVFHDDAFRNCMQYGIESFVANQQGWNFTAIRAPIAEVATRLKRKNKKAIVAYQEGVRPARLKKDATFNLQEGQWDFFVVHLLKSDWTLIVESVHWFDPAIAAIGEGFAADLSKELTTLALHAWDDDFSGDMAYVFEGEEKSTLWTDQDWVEFYTYFYEQRIYLPQLFISYDEEDQAVLMLPDPSHVERADHLIWRRSRSQ